MDLESSFGFSLFKIIIHIGWLRPGILLFYLLFKKSLHDHALVVVFIIFLILPELLVNYLFALQDRVELLAWNLLDPFFNRVLQV